MIRRVEAQNHILYFKLANKGIIFPKFQVKSKKTKIYNLPSEDEIRVALQQAKTHALDEAKKFGMTINETLLENYPFPSSSNLSENDDYGDE